MKFLLSLVVLLLLFGCTTRGGWPRFLRPGEASDGATARELARRKTFEEESWTINGPTQWKELPHTVWSTNAGNGPHIDWSALSALPIGKIGRAAPGTYHLKFDWDMPTNSSGQIGYILWRTNGAAVDPFEVGTSRSVVVSNLVPGTVYWWSVTAYDADGESGPSNPVKWRPDPTNLTTVSAQSAPAPGGNWVDCMAPSLPWTLTNANGAKFFRLLIASTNNQAWIQSFEQPD